MIKKYLFNIQFVDEGPGTQAEWNGLYCLVFSIAISQHFFTEEDHIYSSLLFFVSRNGKV